MTKDSGLTKPQRFWLEHLRACGSGSMKVYAEAQGLEVRALYEAKARLKRKGLLSGGTARVVRVEPARVESGAAGYCRVHLRNGTAVDVACTPEHWATLLTGVAALP